MAPTLTPEQEKLLKTVKQAMDAAEPHHKRYRQRWDHYYALYRSYADFRSSLADASPRDRDNVIGDAKRTFGAELFIPYAYSTVETIVPRMLSNRPRMLITPDDQTAEQNVEPVKIMLDRQQDQVDYELKVQDTAKSGLIYGLGVQKSFWRKSYRKRRKLEQGVGTAYVQGALEDVCVFDDPDAEDIDIYDFFWDPFGYDTASLGWGIHRTWRSKKYVLDRFERGVWGEQAGGTRPTPTELDGMGPVSQFDTIWQNRMQAAGHANFTRRGETLHEVWEFHDGEQVVTVLDGLLPVASGENPAWHGELPFHVFRPQTAAIKQLPGIGEIEPIEDLQSEMNTLRSQRRDNATIVLQRAFAYADGLVDPDDIVVGPGMAIPVNGDPRELIFPLPVGDIPNSGYQEESNLQADIERTTGIADPQQQQNAQTATGVQLVQAAAGLRIQQKTRRCEIEVIRSVARSWLALDQVKILQPRPIPVPVQPGDPQWQDTSPQPGQEDRRWGWLQIGPEELRGEFKIEVEGGSTQPDNVPQKRQDATLLWQTFAQNPLVDQSKLVAEVLRKFDVKHAESWLAPQEPTVAPAVLDSLAKMGVDPQLIEKAKQLNGGGQGPPARADQQPVPAGANGNGGPPQ